MGVFDIMPVFVENEVTRSDRNRDQFAIESSSSIDLELGRDNFSYETPVEVLRPDE